MTLAPTATAVNRYGVEIVPGPYLASVGVCQWCAQPVAMDAENDLYRSATTGRAMCSPEDRGATCVVKGYAAHGIDPLSLKDHDFRCSCQRSIVHIPAAGSQAPYPHPDRIPEHCGQPARLTLDAWVCRHVEFTWPKPGKRGTGRPTRRACGWTVPTSAA
ncbi:hypothetical protein [Micromonospora sp. WMMD980]|uniref:hypothetical protein n=1 Tax=Micromonospora sp. WMMD980 TaxID=3016088 RepID=UPI002415BC9A|nr:hypothetical protein [Micromonospora sp. WMMD980]MDG4801755.1 hypothetical protein [Micromonospora sp. WMMD980]